MSLTPYAVAADLTAFIGVDYGADATRLLARAMELVDAALTSSIYASDVSGNPTDATVLAALKNATCAQAEYWIANGDELDLLAGYSNYSIEGVSVSMGPQGRRRFRLCDRAWDFLRAAKLVPGTVYAL